DRAVPAGVAGARRRDARGGAGVDDLLDPGPAGPAQRRGAAPVHGRRRGRRRRTGRDRRPGRPLAGRAARRRAGAGAVRHAQGRRARPRRGGGAVVGRRRDDGVGERRPRRAGRDPGLRHRRHRRGAPGRRAERRRVGRPRRARLPPGGHRLRRREVVPRPRAHAGGAGELGGAGAGVALPRLPGLLRALERPAGAPRRADRRGGGSGPAPALPAADGGAADGAHPGGRRARPGPPRRRAADRPGAGRRCRHHRRGGHAVRPGTGRPRDRGRQRPGEPGAGREQRRRGRAGGPRPGGSPCL
ncbi:MAG: Indigoidine synthase A-like protein, uncharacterized enzyme involved in pigment biosynthesis, partial [uncultured Frankineae bacterium]